MVATAAIAIVSPAMSLFLFSARYFRPWFQDRRLREARLAVLNHLLPQISWPRYAATPLRRYILSRLFIITFVGTMVPSVVVMLFANPQPWYAPIWESSLPSWGLASTIFACFYFSITILIFALPADKKRLSSRKHAEDLCDTCHGW